MERRKSTSFSVGWNTFPVELFKELKPWIYLHIEDSWRRTSLRKANMNRSHDDVYNNLNVFDHNHFYTKRCEIARRMLQKNHKLLPLHAPMWLKVLNEQNLSEIFTPIKFQWIQHGTLIDYLLISRMPFFTPKTHQSD